VLDGNRLFSRPPLVVEMQAALGDAETLPLWVIINHWKSKLEDSDYEAYTLPRRVQQAQFVAALTNQILSNYPGANLMVIGDLNDYPDSEPLSILAQSGLRDVMIDIPRPRRYTFIYQGVSQVLDYALISPALSIHRVTPQPVHLNADFPAIYQGESLTAYRSSDHDPVNFDFIFLSHHVYLPMVGR
jgi:predicted extracellular nuclease